MGRILISILAALLLWAHPACADNSGIDQKMLRESIKEILKQNPEIIFNSFKGHEDKLYDLLQVGLEKKNKAKIRNRRLKQLENPKKADMHPERPVWGNPDSPVSIIVFSDFQSATCSKADRTIRELLRKYPDISYRYRHNPLGIHKMSFPAAHYYEAIALQDHGKAMKFNHLVLENRLKIKKNGLNELNRLAQKVGADMDRLRRDTNSDKVRNTVLRDIRESKKLGFTASPVFLINGVTVTGAAPLEEFEEVVEMVTTKNK